jgi:hypothetical protein
MTKARTLADNFAADINGITAGTGISGGGTSGTVTVTNSMATTIDTKGDLVVGTGADTFDKLAAGSNGDTLVADSSTSTGLRWQGSAIGKNAFYNSAFDVWQRGTSFALASGVNTYTADRWLAKRGATGVTVSRQTGSTNSQYCIRVQRDSGNGSGSAAQLVQPFEIADAIQYQGKTVTWSFYARKGADYSPASSVLTIVLLTGTGATEGNPFTSAYTGAVTLINTTVTLTTSWQRFTVTANIGATVTQFTPYFQMNPTGTAGADDYFEVSNVQLELGSVATAYARQSGSIQGELAACQRYYYRNANGNAYQEFGLGITPDPNFAEFTINFPVTMRTTISSVDSSTLAVSDGAVGFNGGTITLPSGQQGTNFACVRYTHTSAALTQYRPYRLEAQNSTSAFLGFSAEL